METDEKKQQAVRWLTEKAKELQRLPKRGDFTCEEVCLIKQKLGPWPRALEAVGLKEPPPVSAKDKSRLKREKRKKERREQKKRMLSAVSDKKQTKE